MKNIILALSLMTLCLLSSCGDDPVIEPTLEEKLIGDWTRSSLEIKDCTDSESNFPLTVADADGCIQLNDNTFACSIINFIAGGSGTETSTVNGDPDTYLLSYTIDLTTEELVITNIDGDTFEGILSGESLSFTFNNDEGCTIIINYAR